MTRSNLLIAFVAALAVLGFAPSAEAHYNPAKGRWLERDPVGYRGGYNLYEYGSSAPSTQQDPSGLTPCGFKIKCIQIAPGGNKIPGSHCYLDLGDGNVCSGHNPIGWPAPGPIRTGCWPWESSPDKRYLEQHPDYVDPARPPPKSPPKDPLGPERTTPINCPADRDCAALRKCIRDAIDRIGKCNIPYELLGPNSNTTIWAVFQHCLGSAGCKLLSPEGDPAERIPKTRPGAPPAGWPKRGNDRIVEPFQKCLGRPPC